MKDKYNVIGFLARAHGLSGLNALIDSGRYNPLIVFTHRNNPKSLDPNKAERSEFKDYQKITYENGIALCSADFVYLEDNNLKGSLKEFNKAYSTLSRIDGIDFIVSISWRTKIPPNILKLPRYGCINLHRGKLPDYAGGYPIERALKNGDEQIQICAHKITKEYDKGEVIKRYTHPVNYNKNQTLDENVDRLKEELTPYFGSLLIETLDTLVSKNGSGK